MRPTQDILPITDLEKSGARLARTVAEEQRTILLTDNGRASAVLMDAASYERWHETFALLKLIAQSEEDIEAGRTSTQAEAFERAERAIAAVEAVGVD